MNESYLNVISEKCPVCLGENKKCVFCKGRGIGQFWFTSDKRSKSTDSTKARLLCLKDFAFYLREHGYPNINNLEDLATFYKDDTRTEEKNIAFLEEVLSDWTIYLDKEIKLTKTQGTRVGLVIAAYKRNRVPIVSVNVTDSMGNRSNEDLGGYDMDQVEAIYNACGSDRRYKAIVSLLVSSGPRIGCLWEKVLNDEGIHNFLKFKDLKEATAGFDKIKVPRTQYNALEYIHNELSSHGLPEYAPCYAIKYYSDSGERYTTYCTHEAYRDIRSMLEARMDAGEGNPKPDESLEDWMRRNPESPVFRSSFHTEKIRGKTIRPSQKLRMEEKRKWRINNPKALEYKDMYSYIRDKRLRLKIVSVTPRTKTNVGRIRTPIPTLHGFRHTHKEQLSQSGMNAQVSEWLQGRELKGSQANYDKWPDYKRLLEYLIYGAPSLTIIQTGILKQKNKILKNDNQELATTIKEQKYTNIDLFERLERLEAGSQQYKVGTRRLWALIQKKLPPKEVLELQKEFENTSSQPLDDKTNVVDVTPKKVTYQEQGERDD